MNTVKRQFAFITSAIIRVTSEKTSCFEEQGKQNFDIPEGK